MTDPGDPFYQHQKLHVERGSTMSTVSMSVRHGQPLLFVNLGSSHKMNLRRVAREIKKLAQLPKVANISTVRRGRLMIAEMSTQDFLSLLEDTQMDRSDLQKERRLNNRRVKL